MAGIGPATKFLTPLINKVGESLWNKAIKPVGSLMGQGLLKVSDTKVGRPVAQSLTANAQNDLGKELFYGGGKVGKAIAATVGGAKTLASAGKELIDPTKLKMRKEIGVSARTQTVMKDKLAFLDSDLAQGIRVRAKEMRGIEGQETKLKNLIKDGGLNKKEKLDVELKLIDIEEIKEARKLTASEQKLKEKITDSEKAMQGQLNWQFLENSQQGINTEWLQKTVGKENYYGKSNFTVEDFIKTKDIKPWQTNGTVSSDDMATFYNKINIAQKDGIPSGSNVQMFVKEDMSSRAAGNIKNEINKFSKKNKALYTSLEKREVPFNSVEDMAEFYKKEVGGDFEIIGNKLWFGDSHKSGAYELGGVNTQNFLDLDGTMVSVVNDVNDLFKLRMPAGDVGITVSTPYVRNPLVKPSKVAKKYVTGVKKGQKRPQKEAQKLSDAYNSLQKLKKSEVGDMLSGDSNMPGSLSGWDNAGQNKRQINIARDIAKYKPASLTAEEWAIYVTKMAPILGLTGYSAVGLFSSE